MLGASYRTIDNSAVKGTGEQTRLIAVEISNWGADGGDSRHDNDTSDGSGPLVRGRLEATDFMQPAVANRDTRKARHSRAYQPLTPSAGFQRGAGLQSLFLALGAAAVFALAVAGSATAEPDAAGPVEPAEPSPVRGQLLGSWSYETADT